MHTRTLICAIGMCLPPAVALQADESRPKAARQGPAPVRIGAVAYSPSAVTIFDGIKKYLNRNDFAADYVLYSNYGALVEALDKGHVDIAWNTPLAHAQYHCRAGQSRTLVMRDVDREFRSVLVARADAGIDSPADLAGKTLILGSEESAEATVLPRHYLHEENVDLGAVTILSLDRELDLDGNPCSSERHVLQALREGRGHAGIIGERLWKRTAAEERRGNASPLKAVWTSPAFSHCVFTAAASFDETKAARFRELMLAMDPKDPQTAELMRLEGTRRWIAGQPDGFRDLVRALERD